MNVTLFQILAVLRDGALDSAAVLESLRAVGGASEAPSLPAFYRHLRRATDAGWVEIVGRESEEGPGRPKQLYALTPEGVEAVQERARWLERFTRLAVEGDS